MTHRVRAVDVAGPALMLSCVPLERCASLLPTGDRLAPWHCCVPAGLVPQVLFSLTAACAALLAGYVRSFCVHSRISRACHNHVQRASCLRHALLMLCTRAPLFVLNARGNVLLANEITAARARGAFFYFYVSKYWRRIADPHPSVGVRDGC